MPEAVKVLLSNSRKDAKTQRFLKESAQILKAVFLCAFASLREKICVEHFYKSTFSAAIAIDYRPFSSVFLIVK